MTFHVHDIGLLALTFPFYESEVVFFFLKTTFMLHSVAGTGRVQ